MRVSLTFPDRPTEKYWLFFTHNRRLTVLSVATDSKCQNIVKSIGAFCSHLDDNTTDGGRRAALTKLLKTYDPELKRPIHNFPMEEVEAAWQKYVFCYPPEENRKVAQYIPVHYPYSNGSPQVE